MKDMKDKMDGDMKDMKDEILKEIRSISASLNGGDETKMSTDPGEQV